MEIWTAKIHIHDLASKLNRANAVLAKLRNFVNSEIFLFSYIPFSFKLCIYSLALTRFPQQRVSVLQKKH